MDYKLTLIIWGIVLTVIIGTKPVLAATLWYYEQRLEQEKRRQIALIQQNEALTKQLEKRRIAS